VATDEPPKPRTELGAIGSTDGLLSVLLVFLESQENGEVSFRVGGAGPPVEGFKGGGCEADSTDGVSVGVRYSGV